MSDRRWDIDDRGIGIADAQEFEPPIRDLREAMRRPGWVTEDADAHLGVHLRGACAEPGSPWTCIAAAQGPDGVFDIEVAHTSDRSMDIWREAVALLSRIAEQSFHVRRVDDQTFEAVTGMLAGEGDFATHGHTVRVRIRRDSAGDGPARPDR